MDDNKFLPKLSQNLLEILNEDEYFDVTIEVGNDPNTKLFRSHMVILSHRSLYLRKILSVVKKKGDENNDASTHVKLPNFSPDIFQILLRYIYGGRLSLEEYDTLDIFKTLVTASVLDLQELIPHIQSFLVENKSSWLEQNFSLVYQTSFENGSFSELQKYCADYISNDPDKLLESINNPSCPESLFTSLIGSENIKMKEIQVWEHVIRWGQAQNPGLSTDPTSYSKDDVNGLKKTLQQCIPLVKFQLLSSKEFMERVMPYRKILPKEFYMDLLKEFLNNDYKPVTKKSESQETEEIDSNSINSKSSKIVKVDDSKIVNINNSKINNNLNVDDSKVNPKVTDPKVTDPKINDSKANDPKVNPKINDSKVNGSKVTPKINDSKINEQKVNETSKVRFINQKVDDSDIEIDDIDSESSSSKSVDSEIIDSEWFGSGNFDPSIFGSIIILSQHAELISKWIDKLDINEKSTSSYHGFKLIYRGSRDGLTPKKFHKICDNKARTVTIIKMEGSSEILGGYNPTAWKSDSSWSVTKDSFIFSFDSKKSVNNYILSRVINEKRAIYNGSSNGPSFGDETLHLYKKYLAREISIHCNNSKNSYEKPIRGTFGYAGSVEELEVFQVV